MKTALRKIGVNVLTSYFACWPEIGNPDPGTDAYTRAILKGLMNCDQIVQESLGMQDEPLYPCYRGGEKEGDDREYLGCDFTLTTANYNPSRGSAYRRSPSKRCGVLLAAESELGNAGNPSEILRDFWKLTDIKAAIKVMVYAYRKDLLSEIRIGFTKVLTDHYKKDKTEAWLFLGLPWPREWHEYEMDTLEWDGDRARLVSEKVKLPESELALK
jgi:hypothetical protein